MSPWLVWTPLALLYLAFLAWYRSWKGPLTPAEVERYLGRMAEREGLDPTQLRDLQRFLEQDDGRDFVMVNAIELRERPLAAEGLGPGETSSQVLGRYMAYMWPALLKRACHPVLGGRAAAAALDRWGIDGAERWSQAGMMRYRSRRDLLEIAANPAFAPSHAYKVAAIEKTIAFPIAPYFGLGSARLVLGLALFSLGAALQLAFA
jgi:hypothetical protein